MSTENFNKLLTWQNLFKTIAMVAAAVWFISNVVNADSVRDVEVNQTKKDISEIKSIVKEIQTDVKTSNFNTDSRLNKLEGDVKAINKELEYIKK